MANMNHIIEPERQGLWIAVTFILALLAFVLALVGLSNSKDVMYMTQAEVMLLNKKIDGAKPAAATPAIPTAPAEAAK